jgi:PHD/YefM family antitoxin component YafN of YafNO toxin-antitoxin module
MQYAEPWDMADYNSHQQSFDVSLIASNLAHLHEFVTRTKGRVEITRPGSDQRCVLISQEELQSLERALEILSDTNDVRDMCGQIAQLAAATGPAAIAAV